MGFFVVASSRVLQTYFLYRRKRLVTCSYTLKTVAADIATSTVLRVLVLAGLLFVWIDARASPERQDGGHERRSRSQLMQITASLEYCLERSCGCRKRFCLLPRLDHCGLPDAGRGIPNQSRLAATSRSLIHGETCMLAVHITEVFERAHPGP